MLEIKNLKKIYKNKVGTDVLALDDISLKFPDNGMVFLLGKSGSGKSTLLNVIGGLDNPTKGEIIVKGRSSNTFNRSDFDSYRNTYVGFVFQEYNVLDEFTVYENISLAIELQNKQPSPKMIEDLLDRVGLTGYAKRKPNTLSGGQRQRIAIARALIKNPEIILADEPTGALDSTTGEQVLETLKELSKDTLVIVVSHDRDFAERYADRIIELKDGKVINDVSKSESTNSNVNDDDTLLIKNAKELTEDDFEYIKKFILSSDNDVVLSKNNNDIELIRSKKEESVSEEFKTTVVDALGIKEYDPKDTKFIRSKLPVKHAFRIGISSMKHKKFRLFMTVFLISISFILFGLLSTMTFYSTENSFKDTLANSDFKILKIGKSYKVDYEFYVDGILSDKYSDSNLTTFEEDEYLKYKNKYGKELFYGFDISLEYSTESKSKRYFKTSISQAGYLETDNPLRDKIVGEYPKNKDEIVISSYLVDSMIYNTFHDIDLNVVKINSRDEILGKVVNFNDVSYKIVGYFDSGEVNSKYDILKEKTDVLLSNDYSSYLAYGMHSLAFFSESAIEDFAYLNGYNTYSEKYIKMKTTDMIDYTYNDSNFSYNYDTFDISMKGNVLFVNGYNDLTDDSGILSYRAFANLVLDKYKICPTGDCSHIVELAESLRLSYKRDGDKIIKYTKEDISAIALDLYNLVGINSFNIRFCESFEEDAFGTEKLINIAGIYLADSGASVYFTSNKAKEFWNEHKKGLSYYTEVYTKYRGGNTKYQKLFVPFDGSKDSINHFYSIFANKTFDSNDSKIYVDNYIVDNIQLIGEIVTIAYNIFLYGGIILLAFAVLLFSNFINISINHKLKEIGVLRAVGARGIDVFKIFFAESLFISFMCLIISIAGSLAICSVLNTVATFGVGVSIFVFGFVSLVVLVLLAVLTAFLATYLPVYKASKKKPVDLIRSL